MQVSRNALQSWPELKGENNPNFFVNRSTRNEYFSLTEPEAGTYTAVGGDPASSDWSEAVWEVDRYNGVNWANVTLDKNFALIVTDEGIKALTNASLGQYKLELSRVAIKQTPVLAGESVASWNLDSFINSNGYSDICLDTANEYNTTFTLENNLKHRTNLLNGGIQFTLELDANCLGQKIASINDFDNPTELVFDVAVIGLFVKDQRDDSNKDILFAIANLPNVVQKVSNTPFQAGNNLKFYLNTTLSNLGNVVNLHTVTSAVTSVPEVITEADLERTVDGVTSPYNLYVVDNYSGTNIPAIAIRKGDPTSASNPVVWSYIMPGDDALEINEAVVDASTKSFMVIGWDSALQKYVPVNSKKTTSMLSGLYTYVKSAAGNEIRNIIYAGRVTNPSVAYTYSFSWDTTNANGYKTGDLLTFTVPATSGSESVTFSVTITDVNAITGQPLSYTVFPQNGNLELRTDEMQPSYVPESIGQDGSGLIMKVISTSVVSTAIAWGWPSSWVNKPLFADYDHTSEDDTTWTSYLTEAGLPSSTARNRSGHLTVVENDWTTSHFVGWCIDENTIKLALDLRNDATETVYGTTRYATRSEVANVVNNQDAMAAAAVTPQNLKGNFLQITMPTATASNVTNNITNDGSTRAKAITVDTYTRFTKSIECTGTDLNGVAFKGTAYRALWEDLAEYYRSDKVYPAGTLICIGDGLEEITLAKTECNGIISTKPGYELGNKTDAKDLPVALIGKVPVLFAPDCVPKFGDRVYLSKSMPGKASTVPYGKPLGKVIDKREKLDQRTSILCSVRIEF